jgi:transposase
MESTDKLIEQIRNIKDQYEAQVTGRHKQWPLAIKERIKALADTGIKVRVIAEQTGISYHTISSWVHGPYKKPFREIAVVDTSRRPVTVAKKSTTVTVTKKPSTVTNTKKVVTVKTPDGFLINAYSISDVVQIICGCRRER